MARRHVTEAFDAAELLDVLRRHEVDFIVVGGVCAVLHGAPVATFDLDIVHRRETDNLARLEAALTDLRARYRHPSPRPILPRADDLAGPGHHLLLTRAGPLDVLGEVEGQRGFDQLLAQTELIELSGGSLRALTLDALIGLKEESSRARDQSMLEMLKAVHAERE